MSNHATINTTQVDGWQLLTEIAEADLPGNERQLLSEVTGALEALNLEPLQLERIREAFRRAVTRAMRTRERTLVYPIRVRLWFWGSCFHKCGSGFFLLEKQSNDPQRVAPLAQAKVEHHIELFLYREQDP